MTGFDAGEVVAPLDYDFTTIKQLRSETREKLQNAKGTIPEPSDKQIQSLIRAQRKALTDAGINLDELDPEDATTLIKVASKLTEEQQSEVSQRVLQAVVSVCDGSPTEEEITALPQRVQNAFIAWLMKSLTDPESAAGATKPSLAVVRAG
jgi:hypothetical protein